MTKNKKDGERSQQAAASQNQEDFINETESYVLVEGPGWGAAEFYGGWLLAAAKAEALWKEAVNDANFYKQLKS